MRNTGFRTQSFEEKLEKQAKKRERLKATSQNAPVRRSSFKARKDTPPSKLDPQVANFKKSRKNFRRVGKVGRANIESRKKIAEICEEKQLNRCELNFIGCMQTWPLAPAHRHKRAWYKGDVELLADFNQWVVACVVCHDTIEHDGMLTEELFNKLRP